MTPGTRVSIGAVSGIDSSKTGTVIPPVDWRSIPGLYERPSKNEICIKLDNGRTIFMFAGRVFPL